MGDGLARGYLNRDDYHYIYAFIESEKDISITNLKNHLKTVLPGYMIPNKFVTMKELPLTSNGKIDRKKLEELI